MIIILQEKIPPSCYTYCTESVRASISACIKNTNRFPFLSVVTVSIPSCHIQYKKKPEKKTNNNANISSAFLIIFTLKINLIINDNPSYQIVLSISFLIDRNCDILS